MLPNNSQDIDEMKEPDFISVETFTFLDKKVASVPLRGLDGFNQDAAIEFAPGLSIVHASSGGEMTRLVRWISHSRKYCPVLMPSLPDPSEGMTIGKCLIEIASLILFLHPDDSCTLIDDAMKYLDPSEVAKFFRVVAGCGKQVILTVDSGSIDWIKGILGDERVHYVELESVRRGACGTQLLSVDTKGSRR